MNLESPILLPGLLRPTPRISPFTKDHKPAVLARGSVATRNFSGFCPQTNRAYPPRRPSHLFVRIRPRPPSITHLLGTKSMWTIRLVAFFGKRSGKRPLGGPMGARLLAWAARARTVRSAMGSAARSDFHGTTRLRRSLCPIRTTPRAPEPGNARFTGMFKAKRPSRLHPGRSWPTSDGGLLPNSSRTTARPVARRPGDARAPGRGLALRAARAPVKPDAH